MVLSLSLFSQAGVAMYIGHGVDDDDKTWGDFYTLGDQASSSQPTFQDPAQMMSLASQKMMDLDSQEWSSTISLLNLVHHNENLEVPTEKYVRKVHFGGWRSDSSLGCYDVRGLVLSRNSLDPVQTHQSGAHCVVDSGRWNDPYTGNVLTASHEIQIDHVVPLKNAYVMGAWKWSKRKRCWYANFIANKYHLLPVSGHENMVKSDDTPANYMPPDSHFQCEYLKTWLRIKMAWGLALVQPEVDAIHSYMQSNNCDANEFTTTTAELQQARNDIDNNSPICQ